MSGIGHNSGETTETVAAAELRQFIERWERLEEEKRAIASDQKDIMSEAKGRGYDTKAIREIIKRRKQDANERIEFETILETYMDALGMTFQQHGIPMPSAKK